MSPKYSHGWHQKCVRRKVADETEYMPIMVCVRGMEPNWNICMAYRNCPISAKKCSV